jgi:hypothetical protein
MTATCDHLWRVTRNAGTSERVWGCDRCGAEVDGPLLNLDEGAAEQLTVYDALADVIPSRSTDPVTSHAAAREIRVKAGTQRARLLEAFAQADQNEYHSHGGSLTDEQAMERAHAVSPLSEFSKRCSELRQGGFIEPTGETRAGSAGPQRIVSRITGKGRAWIEANR